MPNDLVQKLKELLSKNQEIAVIVPGNPSLDAMAAGLGLYLVLQQMGKNIHIVCPTQPTVALSSLVGIDRLTTQLSTGQGSIGGDLVVSFPYKQGETGQIEKVEYEHDEINNRLKIVVHAGEQGLHFSQSDVRFEQQVKGGAMPTLIFYVGVTHPESLGSLFITDQGVSTVNIDNNPTNPKYGTLAIVDTRWSSVSEQIADFVTLLEPQVVVQKDASQNLLSGISFATQDFTNPRTSYLAFEVAGILMKKGASRDVAKQIISQSTGQGISSKSEFFPPVKPIQQQTTQPQPFQQPVTQQNQPQQQPSYTPPATPPDWLTPKVYKGSTLM